MKFWALAVLPLSLLSACGGASDDQPMVLCSDPVGECSETLDVCGCGTTCMRVGEGQFECRLSCTSDGDCASLRDPTTGDGFSACVDAKNLPNETYGRYCN